MSKKKNDVQISKKDLLSAYMSYTLEEDRFPASVYKFCKHIDISESQFYTHFGSMEGLQRGVWVCKSGARALGSPPAVDLRPALHTRHRTSPPVEAPSRS